MRKLCRLFITSERKGKQELYSQAQIDIDSLILCVSLRGWLSTIKGRKSTSTRIQYTEISQRDEHTAIVTLYAY